MISFLLYTLNTHRTSTRSDITFARDKTYTVAIKNLHATMNFLFRGKSHCRVCTHFIDINRYMHGTLLNSSLMLSSELPVLPFQYEFPPERTFWDISPMLSRTPDTIIMQEEKRIKKKCVKIRNENVLRLVLTRRLIKCSDFPQNQWFWPHTPYIIWNIQYRADFPFPLTLRDFKLFLNSLWPAYFLFISRETD